MTDELDLRLSAAFRSLDLPAAGPRLTEALEGLRVATPARGSRFNRRPWIALLAAAASVVVAIALVGQLGIVSFGPSPSPTPTPTLTPTSAPPSTTPAASNAIWDAYTVATLLTARAAGEVKPEPVFLVGYWTDLRPDAACGTPTPSPLLVACGDGQFGLTEAEEPIGAWNDEVFVPTDGPALTPFLPAGLPTPGLGRSLIGVRDDQGDPSPPIQVSLVGQFDSPLADACPAALRQACLDRFVIDEILWAEVINTSPTPKPSQIAHAADDPPPAAYPQLVENCAAARTSSLEPGDPARVAIVSSGWVPFEALDVQPLNLELISALGSPAWVYIAVTEPDVMLSLSAPDPAGGNRTFRYVGQAVCIGWDGMQGMMQSTVPGTTYELWSDAERVPLAVFPPEVSPSPKP